MFLYKSTWGSEDFIQPARGKNKARAQAFAIRSTFLEGCTEGQTFESFTTIFEPGNWPDSVQWCRITMGLSWNLYSSPCYLDSCCCDVRSIWASHRVCKEKSRSREVCIACYSYLLQTTDIFHVSEKLLDLIKSEHWCTCVSNYIYAKEGTSTADWLHLFPTLLFFR